ncbi:Aste57867_9775 [Aphanomyces stellatus]|uniref:Aste57867_9775 protein n=1 Tax=Aphanomyces stellatus TaxID=120398 RepID=A0A485KNZ7_9STRA|nr:hypothetical protein As57867_009736 [Aphanomyces stellatus]VFT86654.1 Aste57867_9775 [Aphanomyces stellatus]
MTTTAEATSDRRQLRMLTRGFTQDCIEDGVLEPTAVVDDEPTPHYPYSTEFVRTLDVAIRANFGSALWQDILQAQNVPPHYDQHVARKMTWSADESTGTSSSSAVEVGPLTGKLTGPKWGTSGVDTTLHDQTADGGVDGNVIRPFKIDARVVPLPPMDDDELQKLEAPPTPTHSIIDEDEPVVEIPGSMATIEDVAVAVDEMLIKMDEEVEEEIVETSNGPTNADVLSAVPPDAMCRLIRLAQTIKLAAKKFKALLRPKDHPYFIHLLHADDLRAADWNGASDPYVLVSCFEAKDGINTQTAKTEIIYKTLAPKWDQRLVLPGVKSTSTLCLTVLDYDFGSNPDFLGQVMVPLESVKTITKVQLGPLMHIPTHPDGTLMQFGDKTKPGQGSITFAVERCPHVATAGDLQVLRPTDASKWFASTPVFQPMFVTLFETELALYSVEDKAVGKRTATVPLASIDQMLDDGDEWTLRLKEGGVAWRFRVDYGDAHREDVHDLWLKALCRTTRRPVLVEASPTQFQFKYQPVAYVA